MNHSVKGALLSGAIFPGLGQVVLKHYVRGIALMLAVSALSSWWFYKLSPRDAEKSLVWLYNMGVLVVGVLICTGLTLRLRAMLADTPDRAWWPVLSAIISLLVLPLWLAVCGVVRNLLVFRSGQRSG